MGKPTFLILNSIDISVTSSAFWHSRPIFSNPFYVAKKAIKLHLEYSNNDVMPLNVRDTREGLVQYLLPLRVCYKGDEVISVTKMSHYCD